ncbi:class I SAM-dependent methyltransferase [Halobium salinum]|uniref:Class I SAM-dependent methyltransferase n=1 Tax=Halobium salinum TaxID=1364940 RepID=A0ABD5PFY9_9EURY|nr:class I SAM-dependent methyltransferase [Halobium salinum]
MDSDGSEGTDDADGADGVRRGWAERSGTFSPAYYADLGPNEVSETLASVLDFYADDDAAVLELGCGSGRHLAHLREQGFENLAGVDINDEAFEVMADHYPVLAEAGTFHTGALEDLLPEFDDDAFDVVYSVETLQHIHPDDEWVFEEVARVAGDLLVTAENEGNGPQRGRADATVSYVEGEFPLYHRNWKEIFSSYGFAQLIREPTSRDTIRVFRAP